uniref:NADH-ubiquinone oxidoreductase chain 4 n=1 Tax=Atelura formicaria TaxID=459531 RepID=B5KME1_9INSE|nr:NADH dehydrogenase subunit 4 [Atelura formicaria]ABS88984.1 NADH dehydrogenase subunit 4 [Atelura formicaria]
MLSILFVLLFMIPLCFMGGAWWMVQALLFMSVFPIFFYNWGCYSWGMMGYFLGVDVMSFSLVCLSFWICSLMLLASEGIKRYDNFVSYFLLLIVLLLILLVLTFSSTDLFAFYFFFEGSLMPTLFLILGWGYQPERIQAGVYLLFYTLLASLPLLLSIFYISGLFFSYFYPILSFVETGGFELWYLCMVMAFLVKMPMFLVHLWLPSAHVEAPASGTMILAGVLLKLGGYGLLRVFLVLVPTGIMFNWAWMVLGLLGGFVISLVCLRQVDVKSLVAYSSVAHMGMVLCGIMTMNFWGLSGSLCLMIAHGLCSSGMFCLANITYERVGSRSLLVNKGFLMAMPSLSLWWFLLSAANMAAPPTLNLLGEIVLTNSVVGWSSYSMVFLGLLSFFSAAYSLYLYSYSQHGSGYYGLYSYYAGLVREYLLLFLHWFPLNLLILKVDVNLVWL